MAKSVLTLYLFVFFCAAFAQSNSQRPQVEPVAPQLAGPTINQTPLECMSEMLPARNLVDIYELTGTGCLEAETDQDKRCDCIKKAGLKNAIVAAQITELSPEKLRKKTFESDLKRIQGAYYMLSYGDAFQRTQLNIVNENEKEVSCNADDIGKKTVKNVDSLSKEGGSVWKRLGRFTRGSKRQEKQTKQKMCGIAFDTSDPNCGIAESDIESGDALNPENVASLFEENFNQKKIMFNSELEKTKKSCLSFTDFLVDRNKPSEKILKLFAESSDPEKLLDPPEDDLSSIEKEERINFLRRNPTLVKLSSQPALKKQLAASLKSMAQNVDHQKPNEVLEAYVKFMQNEVNNIQYSKEGKAAARDMCDRLAESFIAATLREDVDRPKDSQDIYEEILMCQSIEVNKKASTGNTEEKFRQNRLLAIVDPEKTFADDFKEFSKLDKLLCAGYNPDMYSQGSVQQEAYRVAFTAISPNPILRSYHDKRTILRKYSIQRSVGVEQINKTVDSSKRDNDFIDWYDANVSTKKKIDYLVRNKVDTKALRDNEKEMARATEAYRSPKQSPTRVTEVKTALDKSIVEPTWIDSPQASDSQKERMTPENMAQGVAGILPSNFSALSPERKFEAIEKAESALKEKTPELIKSAKGKSSEIADLENDISEIKEQLENARKELSEEVAKNKEDDKSDEKEKYQKNISQPTGSGSVNAGSVSNVFPQTFNQGPFGGSMGGVSGTSSFARSASVSQDVASKKEAQINEAKLKTMYASSEISRAPASAQDPLGLILVSEAGVSNLPDDMKITSSLKVSDEDFKNIVSSSEALKNKLNQEILKMKLPREKGLILELASTDSQQKMFISASWENNRWVFSPFTQDAQQKIVRTHTLKGLMSTLPKN